MSAKAKWYSRTPGSFNRKFKERQKPQNPFSWNFLIYTEPCFKGRCSPTQLQPAPFKALRGPLQLHTNVSSWQWYTLEVDLGKKELDGKTLMIVFTLTSCTWLAGSLLAHSSSSHLVQFGFATYQLDLNNLSQQWSLSKANLWWCISSNSFPFHPSDSAWLWHDDLLKET